MKFFTLLAALLLSLSSISVFAQDADKLKGDLKFENVTMGGYNQASTPMAITSDGNVVITGTTVSMTTGAASTFIAMSAKDMPSSPIWNIDLGGRAEVTSIISDGNGGIFVGGNFFSSISFNDINDNPINFSGIYDIDLGYDKHHAFIAHINKDGKTIVAKSISATVNPDVISQNPRYTEFNASCNLGNLVYANGKLYAGLNFQDVISTSDGNKQVVSASNTTYGAASNTSFTVAEIDLNTMGISSFPILVGGNTEDAAFYGLDVKNAKIATDGAYLYLAATPTGWHPTVTLWLNDEVSDRASFHYEGNLNGFYLAKIDLANNTLLASKAYDGEYSYSNDKFVSAIGDLQINGDDLVLAGSFMENCPFDKSVSVVGKTDIFATSLNKSDLSTKSVLTSKFDETDNGDQETFSYLVVLDNVLSVGGYVSKANAYTGKNDIVAPLLFNADDYSSSSAEFVNDAEADEDYITGAVVADGKTVYTAFLSNDQKSYFYHYATQDPTSVKNIEAATVSKDDVIYNLQGMKLRAPQKGLNIVNGKKVFVK